MTGAARGIGRAIAVELAKLGGDVAITARTVTPRSDSLGGSVTDTGEAVGRLGVGRSRSVLISRDLKTGRESSVRP